MHQYLFNQILTDNSNLKQMHCKLEQVLYYINKILLLQKPTVPKNQDQDDQWDSTPKSLLKLSKTTPFTIKNS